MKYQVLPALVTTKILLEIVNGLCLKLMAFQCIRVAKLCLGFVSVENIGAWTNVTKLGKI